jgi:uncharacterized protein YmfQ (DUF2313 family)
LADSPSDAIRRSDTDYATALTSLLPQGSAWPTEPGTVLQNLLLGLCGIWGQSAANPGPSVDGSAADLLGIETDPRYTTQMLPDWEQAFGLPDSCLAEPLTIADRRTALVARVTMLGAQDPQFMVATAANIGYQIEVLEHSPFMCGISQVGDTTGLSGVSSNFRWEIGPTSMRQWWTVLVLQPRLSWFRCGSGQCGIDPMLIVGIYTDLECLLTRIKPAHSALQFDYSGVLLNGAMAGTP